MKIVQEYAEKSKKKSTISDDFTVEISSKKCTVLRLCEAVFLEAEDWRGKGELTQEKTAPTLEAV